MCECPSDVELFAMYSEQFILRCSSLTVAHVSTSFDRSLFQQTPATTPAKNATVDNGVSGGGSSDACAAAAAAAAPPPAAAAAPAAKRTRKPAAVGHMFHLRRVNFHQYVVRKVTPAAAANNGAPPLPNGAQQPNAAAEEQWEIEDGLEPIKDKKRKTRATMVL